MFNNDLSAKSGDTRSSADKDISGQKASNDDDLSLTGNSSNHPFDNENEGSFQGDQLQEFTSDLYSNQSPSMNINNDILTSCNDSPASTSENFFGVSLLPGEPVLETSDKIAYDSAED